MYNARAVSAVVFDEFIFHGKLFYHGHKTCYFSNAIFYRKKRFLEEREKILQRYFHPVNDEHYGVEI